MADVLKATKILGKLQLEKLHLGQMHAIKLFQLNFANSVCHDIRGFNQRQTYFKLLGEDYKQFKLGDIDLHERRRDSSWQRNKSRQGVFYQRMDMSSIQKMNSQMPTNLCLARKKIIPIP